jgi:hypothetical protein
MKRLLRNVFCGVGFCLLLLGFAEAQVGLITAHVDGVQVPSATGPIFTNCGATCSKYDNTTGYYVSGTGFGSAQGGGETLAVAFSTKKAASFTKALTPLAIYTANGGASSGKVTAMLLKDDAGAPGSPIATLVQIGKIPENSFAVIEYKPTKPLKLNAKTRYWLCLEELTKDVQALWSPNTSGDKTSPIYYNDAASCKAAMNSATGSIAPAYAVF